MSFNRVPFGAHSVLLTQLMPYTYNTHDNDDDDNALYEYMHAVLVQTFVPNNLIVRFLLLRNRTLLKLRIGFLSVLTNVVILFFFHREHRGL